MRNLRRIVAMPCALLACGADLRGEEGGTIDFASQVQPIFTEHCTGCHGAEKQKSGLRLDSPEGIRKGGDSGEPLLVQGNPAASHLLKLVSRTDPEQAMPPKEKDRLPDEKVQVLARWLEQGGKLPGLGEEGEPLRTDHWSFQPIGHDHHFGSIDDYLEASRAERGLRASPRAERRLLIRRLYLVMLGLPPTPEEVELFVRDESPDAWPVLVEKVLASPHYGERMARHWLDLVRFAESNGFETNRERPHAWRFRDYVIESFNSDKPYDRFVKEHLAGDALGADIGTGFLVAGPYDIVKSPDVNLTLMQRQDELADMINTTGTAFLGLTLGCARCHNHKFDPVSMKDYYAMQAVFSGVGFGARALKEEAGTKEKARLAERRQALAAVEARLTSLRAMAAEQVDGQVLRPPVNAQLNTESFEARPARFVRFTIRQTNGGEPCLDELAVYTTGGENVALAGTGAVATSSGDLQGYPIHKLAHLNDGRYGNSRSWISNESGKGWVTIEFARTHEVHRIEWGRDREERFRDRLATDYVIELSGDGSTWEAVASSADRAPPNGAVAPDAFLAMLPEREAEEARGLLGQADTLRKEVAALEAGPMAWVANFSQPGPTHRLYRGDPMAKREQVAPDALEVIGSLGLSMQAPEADRRAALADWIARPDNPLTARVMVNRLWQYVFGTGIVDTPSDFGANGTSPTHPELLDWLAYRFVESGWSVKDMMRLLLNSAAFQQASRPNPAAMAVDADSRFLWRFPPRRLEAEAIRDSILAAAGTLDRRMGGPSFHLFDVDRENVVHYHPKEETGPAEWRRMIYLFKIRQEQDAVFGVFDCPDGNQVIPERNRSTTPLQALNLFNSRFVMQQAEILAERLAQHDDRVERAFALLYGRAPTEEETTDAKAFIAEHGLVSFCRAMLNTNEFLFVF